jgi:hypothetical protein
VHRSKSGPLMSALGQERTSLASLGLFALPLKADKAQTCWRVRFVPKVAHAPQQGVAGGEPELMDKIRSTVVHPRPLFD